MKFVLCLVSLCLMLAGCSFTPAQQYKLAATGYNGTSIALAGAHAAGKISPATWDKIQADEALARQHLAEGYTWLQANPTLANVPGLALPPLDPFNIVLAILGSDLAGISLVPSNPPAIPTLPTTGPS